MGWMKQVPTWMAGVIMAVMFAGAWFGATFITTPELSVGPRALLSIIVGAFYGIFMGIWVGRTRRAHGRVGQRPEFSKAVRQGTIPSDVNIADWRRALQSRHEQYRPLRWLAPVLYLPMTALAIWLAVTGQPLFWFGAAFFIAIFIITVVTTPRVLRNTATMLTELDRREATQHFTQ